MIVSHNSILPNSGSCRQIVLLFGLGLVGSEINAALHKLGYSSTFINFSWRCDTTQRNDIVKVLNLINLYVQKSDYESIHVVWSAGSGGFISDQSQFEQEYLSFKNVLYLTKKIRFKELAKIVCFHFISSAGGLFEGVSNVNEHTEPRPVRPYGLYKARMESDLLHELGDSDVHTRIYRLSTVYGYRKHGRAGVVTNLLLNGIHNRETIFFGGQATIRDYVYSSDIGNFVARIISKKIDLLHDVFLLVSSNPVALYEVKAMAEHILRKKIFVTFCQNGSNSANISFDSSCLPNFWNPNSLDVGMRMLYLKMLSTI